MRRTGPLLAAFALAGLALAGEMPGVKPTETARRVAALEQRLAAQLAEGTGFAHRARYEALLAEASAVAERSPKDPAVARAYLVIARCCEVLGQHPEKEAAFGHYIDALVAHSKADAATALRAEVEALVARRELYAAIKILRLMLARFPEGEEAAYALYRLGTSHLWLAQYDEAAKALSEGVQRWPKGELGVEAQLRLDRAYFAEGKHGEATGLLEACLAQHPKTPRRPALLFDLAVARYLSADYYGAIAAFQRVVAEAPDSPYAPLAKASLGRLRSDVLKRLGD